MSSCLAAGSAKAWGLTAHTQSRTENGFKRLWMVIQGAVPNTISPQHFKLLPQTLKWPSHCKVWGQRRENEHWPNCSQFKWSQWSCIYWHRYRARPMYHINSFSVKQPCIIPATAFLTLSRVRHPKIYCTGQEVPPFYKYLPGIKNSHSLIAFCNEEKVEQCYVPQALSRNHPHHFLWRGPFTANRTKIL